MEVLDVDRGVATLAYAGPGGRERRKMLATVLLTRTKCLNGYNPLVLVEDSE